MKKFLLWVAIICIGLFFANCRSNPQTSFNIQLAVKGKPATKITLEELNINKVSLVDVATTDSTGSCILNGKYKEAKIFRVNIEDVGQIYVVIDAPNMTIELDPHNLYQYVVEGSARSAQLRDFLSTVYDFNKALVASKVTPVATTDSLSIDKPDNATLTVQHHLNQFIKTNADTVSFFPLALFYANFMSIEDEASYLQRFLQDLKQRFPDQAVAIDSYKDVFFNNYNNFANNQRIKKDTANHTLLQQTMKDFVVKDSQGKEINTDSFKDRFLLIQFVGSWNENSLFWNKQLKQIPSQLSNYPVQLLSVYIENNKEEWVKALAVDSLPWPQVSNLNSWECPIVKQFHVITIPTVVLVNPAKKIIGVDWTIAQMIEEIKANSQPLATDSLSTKTVVKR